MSIEYNNDDIKEYMLRYVNALAEHLCIEYDVRELAHISEEEFIKHFNDKCITFIDNNVQMYRDKEYKRKHE